MADSLTSNLLLTNQQEGANNNTWGTKADTNFEYIDDKFGDATAISTTGGTTTLTQTQERCNVLLLTGVLVSNATVVFSGRGGTWIVRNGTTGNYSVTAKVSGQTGVEVTQGTTKPVYSNGTDIAAGGADSGATSIPSGLMAPYLTTTAPSGWVRGNGRTIGNASSNASERANSDTETLYLLLWNGMSSSILAIYDSAGSLTTRGASAAADYAANKALALPDLRGRAFFGLDDMGASAAGRLGSVIGTATSNGTSGGTETVTLTTANLAAHTHTLGNHTHTHSATTGNESNDHTHAGTTGNPDNDHTHASVVTGVGTSGVAPDSGAGVVIRSLQTVSSGGMSANHTHNVTTGGISDNHTHNVSGTTSGPSSDATGSAGSGTAHSNMPPCWLGTYIIKL
mgnify:CR=1 FL=1